tara:strand:- start:2270 stop:3157 length:888 start_codon:yes stop_codon:yes gene_type:complete
MSYYERLSKEYGSMGNSGVGSVLANAKTKAEEQYTTATDKADQVKSTEFSKIGTMVGLKIGGQAITKRLVGALKSRTTAQREASDTEGQGQLDRIGQDQDTMLKTGQDRLDKFKARQDDPAQESLPDTERVVSDPITAGEGEIQTTTQRVMARGQGGPPMEDRPIKTFEGEDVGADAGKFSRETGLSADESTYLDSTVAKAGEIAGGIGEKGALETALDTIPVVGEIAGIGTALGEGIHTAIKAHRDQMADQADASSAQQEGATAMKYSGFNRPSFGSMALPSFDTSHSSALLQE